MANPDPMHQLKTKADVWNQWRQAYLGQRSDFANNSDYCRGCCLLVAHVDQASEPSQRSWLQLLTPYIHTEFSETS